MVYKIYKTNELKSTFIELRNLKKQNVFIDCIYRHSSMSQEEFNNYLSNLLEKLSREKKTVFLLSDFNINLLEYEKESHQ